MTNPKETLPPPTQSVETLLREALLLAKTALDFPTGKIMRPEAEARRAAFDAIDTALQSIPQPLSDEGLVALFMNEIDAKPILASEGLVFSYGQVERGVRAALLSSDPGRVE